MDSAAPRTARQCAGQRGHPPEKILASLRLADMVADAMTPLPVVLLVPEERRSTIYPPELAREIEAVAGGPVTWATPRQSDMELPAESEVLFSTWGLPRLDEKFLDALPRLRAVFYAAGTVRGFVTPLMYERGIVLCASAAANAVPVAEFTVAAITMSLKQIWPTMRQMHDRRVWKRSANEIAGSFGSRVGLVSLGLIGRRVAAMLRASYDLEVVAYDPFASAESAAGLGVRLVSLEEIFQTCDVVSLHTPNLPTTRGMFGRSLFESMKPSATLINTARGAIIREDELCDVLARRTDLTALLDVTDPEPPGPASPFWGLPNVFLTPHIAGSINNECRRMGYLMLEEFRRWREALPLQHQILPQDLERMA